MKNELIYITVALTKENADKAVQLATTEAQDTPTAISDGVNIALERA